MSKEHPTSDDLSDMITKFHDADNLENQVRALAQRMSVMIDRIGEIKTAGEVRDERGKAMSVSMEEMKVSLKSVTSDVTDIKAIVNKGKGAGLILAGLGTLFGTAMAFWDRIAKYLPHAS